MDGNPLWDGGGMYFDGYGQSSAIYDNKVYVYGGARAKLKCLDLDNGQEIWVKYSSVDETKGKSFSSSPVVSFGKVIIADDNNTYCYDHVNGNNIWTAPFGTSKKPDEFGRQKTRDGGIAISDSVVVLTGGRGTACMDIDTGKILWESDVKGCLPVIVGDKYVWTAIGGTLSCLSLSDGSTVIQKEYKTKSETAYSQVAVAKGRVFVSNCWQGKLHCFEMED